MSTLTKELNYISAATAENTDHNGEKASFLEHLGTAIKKNREAVGMTQKELCEKARVSRVALISYEAGRRTPPVDSCWRIANALKVSMDTLLAYNPDKDGHAMAVIEEVGYKIKEVERGGKNYFYIEGRDDDELTDVFSDEDDGVDVGWEFYFLPKKRTLDTVVRLLDGVEIKYSDSTILRWIISAVFRALQDESYTPMMMEIYGDNKYSDIKKKLESVNPHFFEIYKTLDTILQPVKK
ncbi:helix-turn-helix domain-containing protein [uncultured Acidaminococcus sp.]|jgi:transcriptional regulator with XRE-family HTH domain|uniref:helix-turn-helix domain-containing protein n=1 Tax=Acidaminococcus fermentans TaxID=905 RepID=UPI00258E8409|nr:helix-turn-helix domain-containing protein [uncultured Acidaminococcus sp.]